MSYQQGAKGCSFKCMDTEICRMRQLISLSKFMLFIDTGDIEYTLSANVGTKSECAQGLVKIGIINRRESAAKEISNQRMWRDIVDSSSDDCCFRPAINRQRNSVATTDANSFAIQGRWRRILRPCDVRREFDCLLRRRYRISAEKEGKLTRSKRRQVAKLCLLLFFQ